MADVAADSEADSGSGGPSNIAEGNATPEEDSERNDTDRVTGEFTDFSSLHVKASFNCFVLTCFV